MGFGQEFRDAYGNGQQYRAFGPEDRARLENAVPDWFLDLWETDGWASYRGGLLWTVDPHVFEPLVKLWKSPYPGTVVARTAFGSLYLLKEYPISDEEIGRSTAEIDPHTAQYSIVGPEAEGFFTEDLADLEYIKDVLWEPDVKRAVKDLGPLAWDEMYGYEPALALGGSGERETVRRYKLFEHHLLLSQLGELKVVKF